MVTRKEVSVLEVNWTDSQRVDQGDLKVEQSRNNQVDAATIQNHFGSGVLLSSLIPKVLFDTDELDATQQAYLSAGTFDGYGLQPSAQPSDLNLGNQLEIELSESTVFGRNSVKVAVIGLSFDGTMQMERLYFHRNEKQVTSRHYAKILCIFTNDFKGNYNCSRSWGGRLVIREAVAFQLSRDPLAAAQDVYPDVFWRDFKRPDLSITLSQTIQDGIGAEYSVDALSINTTGLTPRKLEASDVTSQVGQKFLATTDNIQKITLLLSVDKDSNVGVDDQFDWSGDMVVSIYDLQTEVDCPTDIIPSLGIEFDPNFTPLAQLSYNQDTLRDYGYVLTDIPQPVDFVFNATNIGGGTIILPGQYYAITIKRSGAAISGVLAISTGSNSDADRRLALFNSVWVDVPEESLWFQVWTDAAKVADGRGYDNGNGIEITKTALDEETAAIIDYEFNHLSFSSTGENVLNTAVIQALLKQSKPTQDEQTGNEVLSRQKFEPSFSFVTTSGLEALQEVGEPLMIGAVKDTNPKINPTLVKTQTIPGLAVGDTFCIINPDPDLLSLNLVGSKFVPNADNASTAFKIFKVTSCVDGYGDVNGDGTIDASDIVAASALLGESLFYSSTQTKIRDGQISTLELLRADVDGDGYVSSTDVDLITQYVNRYINSFPVGSTFTHLCLQVQELIGRNDSFYDCSDGYVRLDGYTGSNIVDIDSLSLAELIYDGYSLIPEMKDDAAFTTVPFVSTNYSIVPQPFWQPWMLAVNSQARYVPCTFTEAVAIVPASCSQTTNLACSDRNEVTPSVDPGRNDFYVPDNLYIGKGEILRPDGSNYSVDLEIVNIVLELPDVPLAESAINIFDKLIADRGDGLTRAGYVAARYSDCTTVQSEDLALNRVRFEVSIQAFYPNIDGYDSDGYDGYGIIVDPIIGVYMDQQTGILKMSLKDLAVDPVYKTLVTKVTITVFLKKAGWKNQVIKVSPDEIQGIISS